MKKIYFFQLGCTKNQTDSEKIIYKISSTGTKITNDISDADIIVVNTCGFIQPSKESSIEAILDVVELKKKRSNLKIYAIGCLVQRYIEKLKNEIPEIDGFFGFNEYDKLIELLSGDEHSEPYHYNLSETANVFYLKIAEGCSNRCTYCAIPLIRGDLKNFSIETNEEEFDYGLSLGYNEIDVIAQDLASYNVNGNDLVSLMKKFLERDGDYWIRLLYIHPFHLNRIIDSFIDLYNDKRVCRYIDLPFQHISDKILKKMGRKHDSSIVYKLIEKLKSNFDDLVIRSSFIVGFPGETDEDYEQLKDFIKQGYVDRAGFFVYSREEDTPAYSFTDLVDENVAQNRKNELECIFSEVLLEKNKKYLNTKQKVIIDDIVDENLYSARTMYEAPEIDNIIYVSSEGKLEIGSFVDVEIIETKETEMLGELI